MQNYSEQEGDSTNYRPTWLQRGLSTWKWRMAIQ